MTAAVLEAIEARYKRASLRVEELRAVRNAAIREALAEGMTHATIAAATGLSRGRINQLRSDPSERNQNYPKGPNG